MKVEGKCHCGMIRYEALVDPDKVAVCHCTDCQELSGTAFRVVVMSLPGTFRLLAGTPKSYLKTAQSGRQREQAFCPECGSPIYSAPVAPEPRAVGLRVGTITQRDLLVPSVQLWARSAQGWLGKLADIPCVETQPEFGPDGSLRT